MQAKPKPPARDNVSWLSRARIPLIAILVPLFLGALVIVGLAGNNRVKGVAILRSAMWQPGGGEVLSASATGMPPPGPPQVYTFEVVNEFKHDPSAFTQGIQHDVYQGRDVFWESTGLFGSSSIREVDVNTGEVVRSISMLTHLFAEGVTRVNDKLYQLIWKKGLMVEYDVHDFKATTSRNTTLKDGWGLTYDGTSLLVTDSSTQLYWMDPETLAVTANKTITDAGQPVPWVNELEWIDGEVWGNVWQTSCVARIDPSTAKITGWVLLQGLVDKVHKDHPEHTNTMDVLNGIAWDAKKKRLFITGKQWPRVYEIKLVKAPSDDEALGNARKMCIPQTFRV